MPKHANQYNILPDDILRPHVEYMWQLGQNDKQILDYMQGKYDHDKYSLSQKTIGRRRRAWGLDNSRATKKKLGPDELDTAIRNVRARFPKMGSRDMRSRLRTEYGWWVPRNVLLAWFKLHEPDLIQERKAKRFKRKRFYAAGVSHIWAMDQHDKWKRFGLWLHIGIEPFSGRILWLRVWWTNSNPRLICGYYINTVRRLGAVPLLTQSDPGSENYGVANAQTAIRHHLDPTLLGTSQHKWKRKHQNIKPEIEWSKLRRRWTPGFEDKLDYGLNHELYNPEDELEVLVFRWIAIPYIQKELDVYVAINNHSTRRHDPHKILPKGIPDMIFHEPHRFGSSLDFKVPVDEFTIAEVESRWAPPDHEVFQLVPPQFNALALHLWAGVGHPVVNAESLWSVFALMVDAFHAVAPNPNLDWALNAAQSSGYNGGKHDTIQLMPDLNPADLHAGITVPVPSFATIIEQQAESLEPDQLSDHDLDLGDDDDRLFVSFSDEDEEIIDDENQSSDDSSEDVDRLL